MSEKRERLRAGVAMLESIGSQLEQVSTEMGGFKTEYQAAKLRQITDDVKALAANVVREYDRAMPTVRRPVARRVRGGRDK